MLQVNSFLACSRSGNNRDCCCPGTYPACKRNTRQRTCSCLCGRSCEDMVRDDNLNAQCAYRVFRSGCGGLRCWYGYSSHAAACNSFRVSC